MSGNERTILVVDDRADVRASIAEDLTETGFRVITASDGEEGWAQFRRASPQLVITDMRMPKEDGIGLLRRVRAVSSVPVILLTAYGDIPTAVEAMRSGATEFLTFPEQMDRAIQRAKELLVPEDAGDGVSVLAQLPGRSRRIRKVRERVTALASLPVPVLVRGDRGTGRDTVIETIHRVGTPGTDFVRIRPTDRAAGDAWSGALQTVVYLDSVDLHPREAQKRWSRRLSDPDPGRANNAFRLLASTSADLVELGRQGSFDAGLAERLARFAIALPPLRDRIEDLPDLIECFVARISTAVGRRGVRIVPAALARLRSHSWPGNLAELRSVLERLVAFSAGGVIRARDVEEVLEDARESLSMFRSRRERAERDELVRLLDECGGNVAEIARRLDMSRSAIHYRLRKHGLLARKGHR